MSTSHPPNAYPSGYHHQLASQPHHQPPQQQYHQPYPATNHRLPGPVQITRNGSRDSTSSGQPSPNRDGRDPYTNGERREAWDPRVERKTRPATIAELADKSREDLWDPNKSLKHWLRTAELARKAGKQYAEDGDYERSFVQLARAATIILERMPTHKDYHSLLSSDQRRNLVLHGQETLENLGKLKPGLVERHDKWAAKYPEYVDDPSLKPAVLLEPAGLVPPVPRSASRDTGEGHHDSRNNSYNQEDFSNSISPRRDRDRERERDRERDREQDRERDRSREPPRGYYAQPARDSPVRGKEEARRAAEEAIKLRTDQIQNSGNSGRLYSSSSQYSLEHAGIAQRQQEAEAAARAARRDIATSHAPPNPNANGIPPVMPVLPAPVSASSQYPPHHLGQSQPPPAPPPPMQVPQPYSNLTVTSSSSSAMNHGSMPQPQKPPAMPYNHYPTSSSSASANMNPPQRRGSNDVDTQKQNDDDVVIPPMPASFPAPIRYSTQHAVSHDPALSTKLTNRYPYPSPVTTTSPPPGPINYPTLMSQHQMGQGYVPSLHSMFQARPHDNAPVSASSLLFQDGAGSSGGLGLGGAGGLYNNPLPQQSMPISAYEQQPQRRQSLPVPAPAPSASAVDQTRITTASSGEVVPRELKTVYLPRESLPRFLNVAAVNTARNRETCGLLLGKDKKSKFVVSTLLIPKQHSTSDTCTMDEEELVMNFTEERGLITLGWIHTHPTQSCFMSSVDLHTHSGFQRMLPESFAVVCAPTSSPNFGIFRLTDPPGLQTVLDCTQKEAFHPHPLVPIYTDADKGHVQIKDSLPLEIVDLRDE